ncbi:hypothetical protein R5W23_006439 [Gemmata sp. JC673]|uniref:Carboxypeptidase regulatory-like domain-containing protein n=1 Tax=Gemmata algarum TaxID=2975278 RepID=A0ABU5EV91_9BACT|nr:hypothetical protein [Gemmata algarum]MDY3559221.1 hypothetical protein [Gemmata algarum]
MTTSRAWAFVTGTALAALIVGCEKPPPPPPPDGASGVRGVCLLPAEPAGADGEVPERRRWADVQVVATRTNISSRAPEWDRKDRTTADASGAYQLALNPGPHSIWVQDPARLKDMAISPLFAQVEGGSFTEFVTDYDQIRMTNVRAK